MKSNLFIILLAIATVVPAAAKSSNAAEQNQNKIYVSIPKPLEGAQEFPYVMLYKAKHTEKKTQTSVDCVYVPVLPTQGNQLTVEQALMSPGSLTITTEVVKKKFLGQESNTSHVQGQFLATRLNTAAYFLSQDIKGNIGAYDAASVYFFETQMLAIDVSKLLQGTTDPRLLKFGEIVSKELAYLCEANK